MTNLGKGDSSLHQMQEIRKIDFNKYLEIFIKKHSGRLFSSEEKMFWEKIFHCINFNLSFYCSSDVNQAPDFV